MSTANRRRSSDDDGDDDENNTCRETCEDFCEDKFLCKVKLFGLFLLLLNVLFFAYKFYYLLTTPADYRASVHVAEKILYPYWFSCCLICIIFAQYGIFEEYQWALTMFEINTFIEWIFLDCLLIAQLIAMHKHGNVAPWNHFTIGMTVARLSIVTLWGALMLYLCQSFERGLREKWEDRTPTICKMFCPCRKS